MRKSGIMLLAIVLVSAERLEACHLLDYASGLYGAAGEQELALRSPRDRAAKRRAAAAITSNLNGQGAQSLHICHCCPLNHLIA